MHILYVYTAKPKPCSLLYFIYKAGKSWVEKGSWLKSSDCDSLITFHTTNIVRAFKRESSQTVARPSDTESLSSTACVGPQSALESSPKYLHTESTDDVKAYFIDTIHRHLKPTDDYRSMQVAIW